jgi:hypothetical protein
MASGHTRDNHAMEELDWLTAEAAALTKLEAENHEFIEQFILQK